MIIYKLFQNDKRNKMTVYNVLYKAKKLLSRCWTFLTIYILNNINACNINIEISKEMLLLLLLLILLYLLQCSTIVSCNENLQAAVTDDMTERITKLLPLFQQPNWSACTAVLYGKHLRWEQWELISWHFYHLNYFYRVSQKRGN